ncbi:alpha/beta fold hydrolase [Streptomyces abyssomicinicus]|uniref:alpha/beta fold hydrolase n=1 Tax=Streptomyces abyssomicinicus TaxID=574929 RepID=UPI00124FF654|nr:alpha/beta hydrolase [Streptomyces abyssomicinicus]
MAEHGADGKSVPAAGHGVRGAGGEKTAGGAGPVPFDAAYDALLSRWPADTRALDLPSRFGTTRVHVCGPEDAPPLVLLPGGGATSMAWYSAAPGLARTHRLYAVDLLGDIGRTVPDGDPLRDAAGLESWLTSVLDGLGLDRTALCGHSYGAWIALRHTLREPGRITRLALLDPTGCFAGLRPPYVLRALPMLLRPTPGRVRSFHRWETGAPPVDPAWEAFLGATVGARRTKVLPARRPDASALRGCAVPTLVLLAGAGRAHDARRVAERARDLLPRVTVVTAEGAGHHSLPTERAEEVVAALREFLLRESLG